MIAIGGTRKIIRNGDDGFGPVRKAYLSIPRSHWSGIDRTTVRAIPIGDCDFAAPIWIIFIFPLKHFIIQQCVINARRLLYVDNFVIRAKTSYITVFVKGYLLTCGRGSRVCRGIFISPGPARISGYQGA